jgi:hypothetical protein
MSSNHIRPEDVTDIQRDVFRIGMDQHSLSPARLSALSGIPIDTIRSWARGTAMPFHGFVRLAPHFPDYLLSLMTEPSGKAVVTLEDGDGNLDELGREAAGYVADKLERESDGVVCHMDKAVLKGRARRIAAAARRAAA